MDPAECPTWVATPRLKAPCAGADNCISHVWATDDICIVSCLASLVLQRWSRGMRALISSLAALRPLLMGTLQPRKRVDVVGMNKKLEIGETRV